MQEENVRLTGYWGRLCKANISGCCPLPEELQECMIFLARLSGAEFYERTSAPLNQNYATGLHGWFID
ncbi:MAG: hypothetical protein AAGG02_16440 [Cyanobacteria bacterium P01_H01_bin.15]